jgi:hypothetical protein
MPVLSMETSDVRVFSASRATLNVSITSVIDIWHGKPPWHGTPIRELDLAQDLSALQLGCGDREAPLRWPQ